MFTKRECQATDRILAGNLQDANIPAPGSATTEGPASRLPLPGQPVTRVIRREHRTSLTANLGCWHARPMSVFATLPLALGCSPWRLRSALAARRLPSRTVATGPTWGTQVSAVMRWAAGGSESLSRGAQNRLIRVTRWVFHRVILG